MEKTVEDVRSGKILLVSHCALNQNAKVRGIAMFPGAMKPLVELLLESDVGIHQMRCPEMTYYGAMRWGQVKNQYDTPMFRRHCEGLAEEVFDQVEEYQRGRYQVLGFVMMDGSPVCGLKNTFQPTRKDSVWGGKVWYLPKGKLAAGSGVFCEALQAEAARRDMLDLAWASLPETDEVGAFEDALQHIKSLL